MRRSNWLSSPLLPAALFLTLSVAMVVTRFHHFGDALHLPDASMAVFFLGGLYLAGGARRGGGVHLPFFALAGLAGLIDWAAITQAGVSDFCITIAYAFLLPAYAVLWYAGWAWGVRYHARRLPLSGAFAVAVASTALSFAISNGSFYWIGGRFAEPGLAGFVAQLMHWGPVFLRTALAYVAAVLLVHGLLRQVNRAAFRHSLKEA